MRKRVIFFFLQEMNGGKEEKQFGSVSFSEEETKNIGFHLSKKLGKDSTTSRTGAGNSMYNFFWKVFLF